ncbi:MAG: metallophosphoesterase [Verrucomicrobia bacterium]|nr:metallophosphoesterase [Verrucomicrobiota bacterium]
MKVAIFPDLHVGITQESTARLVAEKLRAEAPDVIVLAGDLGEPLPRFEQALDLFADVDCAVAVLAGNHDVWNRFEIETSEELWNGRLPGAVRDRGFVWLEEENIVAHGTAVVGTIGWYDYSAKPPEFAHKDDEVMFRTKKVFNNDGNYIDWPWTDVEFAGMVGASFVQRMEAANADPAVHEIIVVTHVPVFPEQASRQPGNNPRAAAYFGNWSLGRVIEQYDKVAHVFSGHTHDGVAAVHVTPRGRGIPCTTVGSDYGAPRYAVWGE